MSRITDLSAAVVPTCPATNSTASSAAPGGSGDAATPLAILGQGKRTDLRKATKTARFLDLTAERHGPHASIPLDRIARISADLAPHVDLNPGIARTALRKAVLSARTGDPR